MKQKEYKRFRNILIELGGTTALVYFANWANILYELEQIKLSSLAIIRPDHVCFGVCGSR